MFQTQRTLIGKVTHSWRTSYLDPEVWKAIIELIYTGDATLSSSDLFSEVIRQMQGLRLDKILTHLQHTRYGENTWRTALVSQLHAYQQKAKLCDFKLTNEEEGYMLAAHAPIMVAAMSKLKTAKLGNFTLSVKGISGEVGQRGRVHIHRLDHH